MAHPILPIKRQRLPWLPKALVRLDDDACKDARRRARSIRDVGDFLDALEQVHESGNGWTALCPAHPDKTPSLSVAVKDNRILIYCHAGCTAKEIVVALGLRMGDLFLLTASRHHRARIRRITSDDGPDITAEAAHYRHSLTSLGLRRLANKLGLSETSLVQLGVGWANQYKAYSFPMWGGFGAHPGHVVGIRLRRPDGSKFAVPGGKNGLFLPWPTDDSGHVGHVGHVDLGEQSTLFICEGPTDTATLFDLGIRAIGRASATSSTELVGTYLRKMEVPCPIVLVTDNDRPGPEGARRLGVALVAIVPSVVLLRPPHKYKDIREWRQAGATASQVLARAGRAQRLSITVTIRREAE